MDPVVTAATIGVAGTVIVGVAGFWSTKAAGDKAARVAADTNKSTLDAALYEQLWDRRASAYEQAIAALLYRQQRRRQQWDQLHEPQILHLDPLYSLNWGPGYRPPQPYFDRYPPREWFDAEGTLRAYATPEVIKALDAAREADAAARAFLDSCHKLRPTIEIPLEETPEEPGAAQEAPVPDAEADAKFQSALEALEPALRNADEKDNDLIKAIRDDLKARPGQARPATRQ